MSKKGKYSIQFEGLSLGSHDFEFELNKELFADSGIKEIRDAQLSAEVMLNKSSNMMDLDVTFKGHFILPCDRCDEDLTVPVDQHARLVVKYGQVEHGDFEDLMVLEEHEHSLELDGFFYENLCLYIPQRNVHQESACDPNIIAMLNKKANDGDDDIDPRWQELKKLS